MRFILSLSLLLEAVVTFSLAAEPAKALSGWTFPTVNRAPLDHPDRFYMGVDREGERVWQGGTFGFTRMPIQHQGKTIFTQFHEGIDIAPLHFDEVGNPTDEVRAMAAGTVVLVEVRGSSSYGNQVVVRHDWQGEPVFSRYAHLASVVVQTGDTLASGQVLGILGSSGGRFESKRAHLHLELGLLLNSNLPEPERYRPVNWAVLDPAPLLQATTDKPEAITLNTVAASLPHAFTLECPGSEIPDILRKHPWLSSSKLEDLTSTQGWRIQFTAWGFPLRFEALQESSPAERKVILVDPQPGLHSWHTRQILTGEGPTATLGPRGELLLDLIFGVQK